MAADKNIIYDSGFFSRLGNSFEPTSSCSRIGRRTRDSRILDREHFERNLFKAMRNLWKRLHQRKRTWANPELSFGRGVDDIEDIDVEVVLDVEDVWSCEKTPRELRQARMRLARKKFLGRGSWKDPEKVGLYVSICLLYVVGIVAFFKTTGELRFRILLGGGAYSIGKNVWDQFRNFYHRRLH